METKRKKHNHGSDGNTSPFVTKKLMSRHHPPICQHYQHEMRFFTPLTHLTMRRHIEMVPNSKIRLATL